MIEVEKVTKVYGGRTKALNDVSLVLSVGKIIGIVGDNGAGKSTLLKLIAGFLRPTKGVIRVDGQLVNRQIASKVALLSNLKNYYPNYTLQAMIDYYEAEYPDFDLARARELAQLFKLNLRDKIENLSSGNRLRVKLVLVLARKVPYLLLDEPFAYLDPVCRKKLVDSILKLIDFTTQTVIITTHDLLEIESVLEMVVAISNGHVIAMKDVEEIRSEKQLNLREWMETIYT
ncbi:MAG: transporter ATP-binding protein YtrB [Bacillota bacterium]|jgi:ABC-2 type transport system ATP-binding protein